MRFLLLLLFFMVTASTAYACTIFVNEPAFPYALALVFIVPGLLLSIAALLFKDKVYNFLKIVGVGAILFGITGFIVVYGLHWLNAYDFYDNRRSSNKWLSFNYYYTPVALTIVGPLLLLISMSFKNRSYTILVKAGLITVVLGILYALGGFIDTNLRSEKYDGQPCPKGFNLGTKCGCYETADHAFLIEDDGSKVSSVVIPASDKILMSWLDSAFSDSLSWDSDTQKKMGDNKLLEYFSQIGLSELQQVNGREYFNFQSSNKCQMETILTDVKILKRGTNDHRYFWVVSANLDVKSKECIKSPPVPFVLNRDIEILLLHRRISEESAEKYANPRNVNSPGHMVIERVRERNAAN